MDPSAGDRPRVKHRLRRDALDWLDVDGYVVALDTVRSVYLSTNNSGAELWLALANGATSNQLAERLIESYALIEIGRSTTPTRSWQYLPNGDRWTARTS